MVVVLVQPLYCMSRGVRCRVCILPYRSPIVSAYTRYAAAHSFGGPWLQQCWEFSTSSSLGARMGDVRRRGQHSRRHSTRNDTGKHGGDRNFLNDSAVREAYTTLGLPLPNEADPPTWEQVRQAFVRLALVHHPDSRTDDDNDSSQSVQDFVKVRQAFETIRDRTFAGTGGSSAHRDAWQVWHGKESPVDFLMFDMNDKTRAEVIHVYKTMSQGGKDQGGYWEMARQLAERDEQGRDIDAPQQITDSNETSSPGRRRRRR